MPDEPVGTIAEEAARLIGAVRQHLAVLPTDGAECAWCPLCRLIALLRGGEPNGGADPRRVERIDLS